MATEKTQLEKTIEANDARLKKFLGVCVTRDGSPFAVTTLQRNSQGMVVTIKGTVTVKNTGADAKEKIETIPMYWNVDGKALANSINIDLVTEENISKRKDSL